MRTTSNLNLAAPTIHLNGSSAERLIEALNDARIAVSEANDKLRATTPHARDYYVDEDGAYVKARDEHYARLSALKKVSDELTDIACAIHAQKR
jgi:hypothetical protein